MIRTGKLLEETGIDMQMTEICRKWIKLYHKGRVLTAAIILLLAVGMTGCGKDTGAAEQPEKITAEADESYVEEEKKQPETSADEDAEEKEPEADQMGQDKQKEEKKEKKEKKEKEEALKEDGKSQQTETEEQTGPETESKPQADTAELNGTVRSVSADRFVISKIYVEHHDDYDIAVSVADGAQGEELITVYVTDTAVYQYLTVKNSGINPEDITSREGSYGDLQEGLTVILKGYWEEDSFYANELVMERFT